MPGALRAAAPEQAWVSELAEFVRIPSISSDETRRADVAAAAGWVARFAGRLTDDVEILETASQPLVLAHIAASNGATRAPRVLVYGHFDVQPAGDEAVWRSPPFEPEARDDWLYGRGVTDDKGNLYMLLKATEQLAQAGALPVDVFVACDGEEECGGDSLVRYLAEDTTAVDAAILFDGQMPAHDVPVFKLGTRGLVYLHVSVRTGDRTLHSGAYGGVALNAADALLTMLESIRHLPERLRSGTTPPAPDEIPDWAQLPDGQAMLDERGARPRDDEAVAHFHRRTLAEPALDIHGIDVGEAHLTGTSIPVVAAATLSIRLASGQDPDEIAGACADALRSAAPTGADVTVEVRSAVAPSFTSSASPVIRIGLEAFERVLGRRPLLTRSGGSVPVRAALSGRSIPTIHTGFDVPSGNAHAPDERLYLPYLTAGIAAARETLVGLGALNGRRA